MERGLSLSQLAHKLAEQEREKHDFIAPTKLAAMSTDATQVAILENVGTTEEEYGNPYEVGELAHDQIAARLQIPTKFYRRMRQDHPEILAGTVNHLWQHEPAEAMFRTLGGRVRAVLSDRYNRIENGDIARVVLPVLMDKANELRPIACEVTEKRLYMQFVSERVKGDVKVGDAVQAGVTISNSETGHGAVSVRAMVWRLWCKNGAIAPDGNFRAHHVGRRIGADEDLNDIFADDTRRADDTAIMLKVRDHVKAALDEVQFGKRLDKLRALTEGPKLADPVAAVKVLSKKLEFSDAEGTDILRQLIEGADITPYGVMNAVTFQAHATPSFDRAIEFEAAGGKLLEFSRADWKEITEAKQ